MKPQSASIWRAAGSRPGLIDCHTHLVYGGNRAHEFELRLAGATYEEIARAGGGIISTVKATRAATEDQLVAQALPRLDALIGEGVTTVEIKSGYGLDMETEARQLRAARRLAEERPVSVATTFLGAHALPPEADDKDVYIARLCAQTLPAIAEAKLADAVDAFMEGIAFSGGQTARVFEVAKRLGLPVKLHADQLSNLGGANLAARYGALSADHLEYTDEAGAAALAKAGTVAVLLPGAFYFLRETQKPPVELFRKHGTRMAIATDSNPGSSPLTSLLLTMNMAATLFRLTVEEIIAGVTREAARALGRLPEVGTLEAGKWCDLAIWNVERLAELPYRMGFNPLHAAGVERPVSPASGDITLQPGAVSLDDWRAIYRGAGAKLDPACLPAVEASAHAVEAIVAKGEPVYGINTGFGKLASVRIEAADLARLQTNIVLSHAAGVGEPAPVPVVRLMLTLKLASLAQGASGVRPATIAMLEAMLDNGLMPVVPCQGSVGASGDLAPLAHMAAAMIGVGEVDTPHGRKPASEALGNAGLAPLTLGPKEGLALLNGTQFSTAYALAALFAAATLFRSGACHRRALHGGRQGLRRTLRRAHSHAAPASRPDRLRRRLATADGRQRHPRVASPRRRPRAGPLLSALPAAGDGRRARHAAPCCATCSATRRMASPTIR